MSVSLSKNICHAVVAVLVLNTALPAFSQTVQESSDQLKTRICLGDVKSNEEVNLAAQICDESVVYNYYNQVQIIENRIQKVREMMIEKHDEASVIRKDKEEWDEMKGAAIGMGLIALGTVFVALGASGVALNIILGSGFALSGGAAYQVFFKGTAQERAIQKKQLEIVNGDIDKLDAEWTALRGQLKIRKKNLEIILKLKKQQEKDGRLS